MAYSRKTQSDTEKFTLDSIVLKKMDRNDIFDVLSYQRFSEDGKEIGYGLDIDKMKVVKAKYVPAETKQVKHLVKDYYNSRMEVENKKYSERVDFCVYYSGELTDQQKAEYYAVRDFRHPQYYVLHGRVYASGYGFRSTDPDIQHSSHSLAPEGYRFGRYTKMTYGLAMQLCANLTERDPRIQFLALEEYKQAQAEQKAEQQKQAEIDKHQSTLQKYCDEAAMYPLKPQKITKKQEVVEEVEAIDNAAARNRDIAKNIKKHHPEIDVVEIVEMHNIRNKQNGRPECHFMAEATGPDCDNPELDEDGNYATKHYIITGIKSGKYFESQIEEQDELALN